MLRIQNYVKGGGEVTYLFFTSYNQIRGHDARWMNSANVNSANAGPIDAGVKIALTKYQ